MFGLFKKKVKEKQAPQLYDIDAQPLFEGDFVDAQRYELGKSKIVLVGLEYFYESLESKKRVSYVKMIDAITENQKVKKIED